MNGAGCGGYVYRLDGELRGGRNVEVVVARDAERDQSDVEARQRLGHRSVENVAERRNDGRMTSARRAAVGSRGVVR
jgi:hypothetical protein